MFYCDQCAEHYGYPTVVIARSTGTCEVCRRPGQNCNDVPSSHLPHPRTQGKPPWFREPRRLTLHEIARQEEATYEEALNGVRARGVPIKDGRVHERDVGNVRFAIREARR